MQELYFTIGHSTRSVAVIISLLNEAGSDLVVDVRSIPRSATNPQFNRDAFPEALAAEGIGYRHIASLGGLRGRRKGAGCSLNTHWENASFRNYADYAMTSDFQVGLRELHQLAKDHHPAVMCAEAVWWRCHRRIITDYLLIAGAEVRHILGPGKIDMGRLTPGAVPQPDGTIIYPASQ